MSHSNQGEDRTAIIIEQGTAPRPLGNYSHACKAGGLVFLAGQGARDASTGKEAGVKLAEDGSVISYEIEVQTKAVIENMIVVLKASGCAITDVVDVTVFLKDMNDFTKYNSIYSQYFSFENPPARTTVAVADLPGNNFIEIKAIAMQSK
ncbi:MAG: RidA family protein [Cyanobacteria bacterium SZAS-4]|nr:RidA family protein [Cyanobacteria bacterium SZAS-4]